MNEWKESLKMHRINPILTREKKRNKQKNGKQAKQ